MKKGSGVLLHLSSLPGYGIGGFGKHAFKFCDLLKRAGFSYWQILPLNPTSPACGNSPYSSISLFAGNPYFLDLDFFVQNGMLDQSDLNIQNGEFVNYDEVDSHRKSVLKKAFSRCDETTLKKIRQFAKNNPYIKKYALFQAAKDKFNSPWYEWPEKLANFDENEVKSFEKENSAQTELYLFEQYFFFKQAAELKKYAKSKGIQIIGDFPVYASFDSADVWADRNLFDVKGFKPKNVAGVPPDYFSEEGQLWGNPVFNIAEHKKSGYGWMKERFRYALKTCDVLRVDHFRGYHEFWAVPYGEKTAKNGKWKRGFGKKMFDAVLESTDAQIIAEDLGIITDEVTALKDKLGFPGMNILQFAFDSYDCKYLTKNHAKNSVSYIGTHDNDTLVGWLEKLTPCQKHNVEEIVGYDGDYKIFFDELFKSKSDVVILSMQDILGLNSLYRMNTPSVPFGNWAYKMKENEFDGEKIDFFAQLNKKYGR